MNKAYKFYKYTKKHGVTKALVKTKHYVAKRIYSVKQTIDVMADVEDIIKADFIGNPYKRPAAIKKKGSLKIGWVLSPLSAGSGGQNTISRFARFLKEEGHTVTFYIYEGIHPQSLRDAKKILKKYFKLDVTVKKIKDYEESDAIIATGWETAYPVFNLQTKAHKFYFVQDFEPLFYGVGSKTVLAENTYKMGFYGITAGKWLTHRLTTKYDMECDYFDFGADLDIYRPADVAKIRKQKKICFYARPVTERRAFELGIIALEIFHKKHPEYTIEFLGWDVSNYKIPFPYVNRGILPHDKLAKLYQESVACLVLSLTNVSLLPLELLAAGCVPVVNEGENNHMVLGKNDHIRYAVAAPIQLAEELSKAVEVADLNAEARKVSDSVKTASWHQSYEKMENIIKREVSR